MNNFIDYIDYVVYNELCDLNQLKIKENIMQAIFNQIKGFSNEINEMLQVDQDAVVRAESVFKGITWIRWGCCHTLTAASMVFMGFAAEDRYRTPEISLLGLAASGLAVLTVDSAKSLARIGPLLLGVSAFHLLGASRSMR
jgi:hypothetical protein